MATLIQKTRIPRKIIEIEERKYGGYFVFLAGKRIGHIIKGAVLWMLFDSGCVGIGSGFTRAEAIEKLCLTRTAEELQKAFGLERKKR